MLYVSIVGALESAVRIGMVIVLIGNVGRLVDLSVIIDVMFMQECNCRVQCSFYFVISPLGEQLPYVHVTFLDIVLEASHVKLLSWNVQGNTHREVMLQIFQKVIVLA